MDISLALGGGGTRGNAHIGVLRVLEREGFRIRAVAGTSAGGLAAAFYAAGHSPDAIQERFSAVDQTKLFGRAPRDAPALLGLAGAHKILVESLGDRTFSSLRIPCAVTAVDVKQARQVILREGPLVEALLATIAIPGVFPPKEIGGRQLVDGGVLDPVPVSVVRLLAPHLPVVAVTLIAPLDDPLHDLADLLPSSVPEQLVEQITRLRFAQVFTTFMDSLEILTRAVAEYRLKLDQPEVVIRPEVADIGLLSEADVGEVVRLGEQAAEAALPELRRAVNWGSRLGRRFFGRNTR
jgi:NTE family protein